MKKTLATLLGCVGLLVAGAEARTVYTYEGPSHIQNNRVGNLTSLFYQYDTDENLSFSATLEQRRWSRVADGGWFVISPGNNPKARNDELAIMYMDFTGGDVYAYRYFGGSAVQGPASYKDPNLFIASYEDVLNVTDDGSVLTVGFDNLDVSALAPGTFSADWTGVSFGEKIGIWAHFAEMDSFAAVNGRITEFYTGVQSWYDVVNKHATVPEPAGLAALGLLGVLGAGVYRRRRTVSSDA
ncbi:MAG: PEP-CTERM sorting domain-containing protein [Pseudomonadota bacterium]